MTRLAAVDCGTNSIRLLIAEVDENGVHEVFRTMRIVRLGQGVDASGKLSADALERTREALSEYVEIMKRENVQKVRMVATSATRDASNRDEFFAMTRQLLSEIDDGSCAEVISGEEEAQLSFQGAVADLDAQDGPFCVIDLGGGSTEFIVGTASGDILGAYSAQMGCVRLTERIMRSDPPTETEVEIAAEYVQEQLEKVVEVVPIAQARTFVGCAGTFTTLSAIAMGLEEYDARAIHDSRLGLDGLRVITTQLIAETNTQRATHPVIHPGRADVIAGGSVVINGIIELIKQRTQVSQIVISEKDILDGIIAQLAHSV
ncbi:Ppx/GppA family phosphatase [Corynebacterium sp. sy017]|uniref:Ppx/GppA phosphatase family protein n=1 Tax=unclassified Corynebacterium TaxID=2624378 RepID=UPI0011857582|nr:MULTISPECIES: Ppx/GppA phosphatase family protein [unclassified Corynebacterium]MBP3088898.1 Ppx/GppA family phosphatase [Corynebacterium sp. sy017]TSD91230.1 Ppx/GppA family phosphatase [Corynebacterium sp. SY003]